MTLPSTIDVAIIGAGAAGLGAAHALEGSGLSVLILEARDRIGGRGHTVMLPGEITFDVGCEWLHSADHNSFVSIARTLGIAIDKAPTHWGEQAFNIGFPLQQQRQYRAAMAAFYARTSKAAARGEDHAAADCLEAGNRWNPLIDAISTYVNGVELDRVSVHDMDAYDDSELNWRTRYGYGALIAAYGAACPVAFDTQVTRIDHSGARIRIETSRGTLSAAQVIVTVPTDLLANETIKFHPALPDKIAAAAGLPLGLADKVMLALDEPEAFPEEGHLFGATDRVATGSYDLRPFGQPCIAGYFGGAFARQLEDAGEGALAAQAIDELTALLGNGFRTKLKPLAASRWAHDPFACGAYSHALPGHAGDRTTLAESVDGRLFFAGEATSPHHFSTAHGARDSGERAAREVVSISTGQLKTV